MNAGRERERIMIQPALPATTPMENVSDERQKEQLREERSVESVTLRGQGVQRGWKQSRTRRWMQRPGERVRERCTACILKRHFMVTADWCSPFRHARRAANREEAVRLNVAKESCRFVDIYVCSVDGQGVSSRGCRLLETERVNDLVSWKREGR